MYVVTFYSFKGGVGRSMALVNVGVQLAKSGKKVLLVDFDLEAPGLPTFNLAKPAVDTLGVVDYVTEYIASGESPEANGFIYESEQFEGTGRLYVMPVGLQDAQYSRRLNSIDWQRLYTELDGYLFFEDLRRQWEALGFDYVLIDSRTGHSDVEGICTRQLPNAVCLLFFPNEQNLNGLLKIVSNIRADRERTGRRSIALQFVVSNVPDLDDEHSILHRTLTRFKTDLGYKELAAEIHHYNSLSLINQEIFSLSRPNSRLSKEYTRLTNAITAENLGDRAVVIDLLRRSHRDFRELTVNGGLGVLSTKLEEILKNFSQDGEICYRVALLRDQMGNNQDALNLLRSDVVEKSYAVSHMYALRARISHRLGMPDEAVKDLTALLESEGAVLQSFLESTSLVQQLSPSLFERLPTAKAFLALSERDRAYLAYQLEDTGQQLQAKLEILKALMRERIESQTPDGLLSHSLSLAYISNGDFEQAIQLLEDKNQSDISDISNIFNLAMAYWGRDGTPRPDLLEKVVQLDETSVVEFDKDANYSQCLGIAHVVLGDAKKAITFLNEAKGKIRRQPRRLLSGWQYTKANPKEFIEHVEEIQRMIDDPTISPRFLKNKGQRSLTLH